MMIKFVYKQKAVGTLLLLLHPQLAQESKQCNNCFTLIKFSLKNENFSRNVHLRAHAMSLCSHKL